MIDYPVKSSAYIDIDIRGFGTAIAGEIDHLELSGANISDCSKGVDLNHVGQFIMRNTEINLSRAKNRKARRAEKAKGR